MRIQSNEAEYEALIGDLSLVKDTGMKKIKLSNDWQIVTHQI